jgi:2',3'-cyclic-nucleotide 2'-phosphodiesterase (5'-nucleotidase family)
LFVLFCVFNQRTSGFFGVVGTDFIQCLNFDSSALIVEDAVVCAKRMVAILENECDLIVALTHCRLKDDQVAIFDCDL